MNIVSLKLKTGENIALPFDFDVVTNPIYFMYIDGAGGVYRVIGDTKTLLGIKGKCKSLDIIGDFKTGDASVLAVLEDGSVKISNNAGFSFDELALPPHILKADKAIFGKNYKINHRIYVVTNMQ
jgi:hypothetical protein